MPSRSSRPCSKPGCPRLVNGKDSRCADHAREREQRRGTAAERGYDHVWRALRGRFLIEHPYCVRCMEKGDTVTATQVDHVVPHRGDEHLRTDWNNLQSLCASHHSEKTSTQDGGFGRINV